MIVTLVLFVVYCVLCAAALALHCRANKHGPIPLKEVLLCVSPVGAAIGTLVAVFYPMFLLGGGLRWCWIRVTSRWNFHPGDYIHYPESWPRPRQPAWMEKQVSVCRWHRRDE